MKTSQGKLLVFEGVDGSGKTTQVDLLSKYLEEQKIPFEVVSFPQYGKNEYANQIYDYLSGKFGKLNEIDPHTIAKIYASDRKTVKKDLKKWLETGKLVIANRYISSSKAHLGANLDEDKRKEFIECLDRLEYMENEMPREDLTILLDIDPKIGQQNVQIEQKPDIHQDNLRHQKLAREIYLELAKSNPNWYLVDCMKNGVMRTREDIHLEILEIINKYINE